MLSPEQQNYLSEIERLVGLVRSSDVPCPARDNVIQVTGNNLQAAINEAFDGSILDLMGRTFPQSIRIEKSLSLINGAVSAPVNTNDLVNITGDNVKLRAFKILGDAATTKNGISAQGKGLDMDNVHVLDIGRPGIETHALVCWDGSHITAKNSTFYAGAIPVLFGGNGTKIQNHVPSEIKFDTCKFGRPLDWKGRFGSKTIIEFKNARNVEVVNSTLENNWQEAPQGHAITITASNYDGNSPGTITENIKFIGNQILNVNGGALALGYGQHHYGSATKPAVPTQRGNNYQFINNFWQINKKLNGGQGALFTTGCEPLNILFEGNTHEGDGDAMMRINDARIGNGIVFRNNPKLTPGTYGTFASHAARGANWHVQFLESLMEGNTFFNAHSVFKSNFPSNTYVAA